METELKCRPFNWAVSGRRAFVLQVAELAARCRPLRRLSVLFASASDRLQSTLVCSLHYECSMLTRHHFERAGTASSRPTALACRPQPRASAATRSAARLRNEVLRTPAPRRPPPPPRPRSCRPRPRPRGGSAGGATPRRARRVWLRRVGRARREASAGNEQHAGCQPEARPELRPRGQE